MYSYKFDAEKGGRVPKRCGLRCAFVATIVATGSVQAFAQIECLAPQKLTPSDVGDEGMFGIGLSMGEDVAVIGATRSNCAAGDCRGSAYIFRFDGATWFEEQVLRASDGDGRDRFGTFVSLSGDTVWVGATGNDCKAGNDCGSAYVFQFDGSTWVEEQLITAPDADAGDRFGSVAVSKDKAMVGALRDVCEAGARCGSVYAYQYDGSSWVDLQKITASDAAAGTNFGARVSISGETAIIGAPSADCAAGANCGAAYIFRFDGATWIEEQKLTASDAHAEDFFGLSVSLSGDTAWVGARDSDCVAGKGCGVAYVFRFNGSTWVEEQKITASDGIAGDAFGSVSVSGNRAVVGALGVGCAAGKQLRLCVRVSLRRCYLDRGAKTDSFRPGKRRKLRGVRFCGREHRHRWRAVG